jgi:SnoaL-like domain
MGGHLLDREAVLAANTAFYQAHEEGDAITMQSLWMHDDDRVVCTHPGWPTLRGWPAVWASWHQLLTLANRPQFIITSEQVDIGDTLAWVSCDENLLGSGDGATVAAINIFAREGGSWRMIAHHGSTVIR